MQSSTPAGFGKTDALLLAMAVIWAVNFSVVKYATQVMSPRAFTGLRVALAAIVLVAAAAARQNRRPTRREILALVALGMLGNGLYQILFVEGVARTRVANAALIIAATPALIAIASRMRGVDRINRNVALGIALSLVGVGFVVLGSARRASGEATLLGTMLVFGGTLCWTTFTLLLQPYARRLDPIHLSAYTMVGGTLPMLLFTPAALIATDWSAVGISAWIAILYASVISMGVAYIFWYRGLRVLGPTRTAMYSNLQPVIAIIVAWIFLRETPTLWQGVGTGTIMSGLFLTRR